MKLTLLIDLDDTLLSNDINLFQREYLKALSNYLRTQIPPQLMVKELLAGTEKMISKDDPRNTLEETFDQVFYPGVRKPKNEIIHRIDDFYRDEFPKLKHLTSEKQDAIRLVQSALSNGYDIVIATNPLFPESATLQRVKWAGLTSYIQNFRLITTFETFHFSKPNSAYYTEILMQIGWPEQPIAIIGNDIEFDIKPALKLGIPTFLISKKEDTKEFSSGNLDEASIWLKAIENSKQKFEINRPDVLLAILKSTPAALDTITRRLTPENWNFRPLPDEWNITQIVCHLRDVDRDVNMPRLQRLLNENNPFLQAESTDPWAVSRNYESQDCHAAIDEFISRRTEIINSLASLSNDQWKRQARHAIFGPTSLAELFGFTFTHDRTHIRQVLETIKLIDQS